MSSFKTASRDPSAFGDGHVPGLASPHVQSDPRQTDSVNEPSICQETTSQHNLAFVAGKGGLSHGSPQDLCPVHPRSAWMIAWTP